MEENKMVNQEAQKIIDASIAREAACKKKVLADILKVVNRICKEKGLRYFAMGKLLSQCLEGEDAYPENDTYLIGMFRKDYDVFWEQLKKIAGKENLRLAPMYDRNGVIGSLNSCFFKKVVFHDEMGELTVNLRLRVEPYEYLPENDAERQEFLREGARKSREYYSLSRNFRGLGDGTRLFELSSKDILKQRIRRVLTRSAFMKRKKAYRKYLSSYQNMKNPVYAGRVELMETPMHRMDEIVPITTTEYNGIRVMIPACPEAFVMPDPGREKEWILEGRLNALKLFDEMTQENDISYFVMEDLASDCVHYQDCGEGHEEGVWMLGLLRKDYEKAIGLLKDKETAGSLMLLESEEEYPYIRGRQSGFVLKGHEKRNPEEYECPILLLPMDAVPVKHSEQKCFREAVQDSIDTMKNLVEYEKGMLYQEEEPQEDSWAYYEKVQRLRQRYNETVTEPKKVFTIYNDKIMVLPVSEVFPVARRPFHDFMVSGPAEEYLWHEKKDAAYTEHLAARRTQVLKVVDEICVKNDISYFAMANLVIGAMIYHDAVPFSDDKDLEIGLLREEYEKLVKVVREQGADYGVQLNEYADQDSDYPWVSRNITFTGKEYSLVRIVIQPFDKIPEDLYLYRGFWGEMDERSQKYKNLLSQYVFSDRKRKPLADEKEEAEMQAYLNTAFVKEEAEKLDAFAQIFNDDDRTDTYARVAFGKSKEITGKELFPLQRVKFRDIEISCPRDTSVWQPVLDEELSRQVSSIQRADLELIKVFDEVCQKLGVGYFICGGTMLGYMRHEGFIPWDDDVDVAMLRADYDRFINEAGPLLPERFFLQTRETDPNIPYLFSKIRLDDTEYITKYNEKRDFHKGICLDIFPFDYVPNGIGERNAFRKEVRELSKQHNWIANRQLPFPEEKCTPRNETEARYIAEQEEVLKYYWSQSLKESQQKYLDVATRYNDKAEKLGLHTVASFVPSYTWIRLDDLLPYQRGVFEGVEVSVPKRPDIFLKMQYGNYMELPPKHMQVAHRLVRWSTWEDSWDHKGEQNGEVK